MKIQGLSNIVSQSINKLDDNSKNKINFGEFLDQQLSKVNSLQKQDEDYKKMLAIGEVDNIHNAMIATEKADLALQLTLSIENKLMDAYKEIMRMQI
ncbi:flagellar hook-basal body complex protein FliE [Senegalia massiliensis]|uniref:Flagellar hook-basal body complex protein FliE n=1 Tax=Senegalia massiliensis TaxID=1720316 RepID=A0A845R338_9CLOT|nr:flagellar hook-basal body complex protein FliE [Senegalia massiliensis]NBI07852.1 flagellar hook-basal body complex protein FliE [Senegalia massiliensis]